jgi:hypothetical protein
MSKLQSNVDTMNKFFTSIGLRINVKKTKFIFFDQMGRLNDSFIQQNRPMLTGAAIERVANQVYLGLHIDEELTSKDPGTYSTTSNSGHSTNLPCIHCVSRLLS